MSSGSITVMGNGSIAGDAAGPASSSTSQQFPRASSREAPEILTELAKRRAEFQR